MPDPKPGEPSDPLLQPSEDEGHLIGAAPEDELIRLERSRRALGKRMKTLVVHEPPPEPEFGTGDVA